MNDEYFRLLSRRPITRSGVKISLVLEPGTSKISIRTSKYFSSNVRRASKINTVLGYISLNAQRDFATGQVKIKVYLSTGQVKILRFFYPCRWIGWSGGKSVVKSDSCENLLQGGNNNNRKWSPIVWHVRLGQIIGGNLSLSLRNMARKLGRRIKKIGTKQSEQISS